MKIWLSFVLHGEYDDFILYTKNVDVHCFWSTLAGVTIDGVRPVKLYPVYKSAIAVGKRPGQLMVEFWLFKRQWRIFFLEKAPYMKIEVGVEEVVVDE